MARRGALGGGSLNPFGGGGVDFGAFNVLNAGNEAYLAFVKVETAWSAGKASNDDYLSALQKYADAQDSSSADWVTIHGRLEQAKYQVARNVILSKIDSRTATVADLVAYDKAALTGLTPDSEEYTQRLDLYRQAQAREISDEEKKQVDLYQAGKLTTTQLQKWYQGVLTGGVVDRNPDLVDSLKGRITELVSRVQDEKDSKMLSDYNDGKVTTHDFLAYATAAKGRYAAGTQQALEWDSRIKDAKTNASEQGLLYRYNLSQQYAQLAEFVKGNTSARGGTSTSTSKRVVLGADGQWHTVITTSTHATKPSAAEIASHAKLQVEITDAKRQMQEIASKVSAVGGFVSTQETRQFYVHKLGSLARGSAEWYAVQGKIDNLNDRLHQEQVSSKEGIRITYPSGGGGGGGSSSTRQTTASGGSSPRVAGAGGGGYSLDQFMRAIATQESGGRYTARNSSTGAYGKYQILPSNWSSWAQRAGLAANAPQTPENQEKVAAAAFKRLASSYHNDWSRVAAAWFAGVAGSADPNHWGPRTVRYVDAIMSHMGTTRAAVASSGGTSGSGSYHASAGGGSAPSAEAPKPSIASGGSHPSAGHQAGSSGLSVIVSAGLNRNGENVQTREVGFPTNLDGRQFEKFYANYERAFESGAESFVDTSSGRAVAYFIGDDPAERIDRMRHLDDLRVKLFDTRAIAYQGTASELTAINARNNAYKDVARHEYLIIDTSAKTARGARGQQVDSGSLKTNAQTNPIASGIRVLDKTAAAVKSNIAAAEAAYKRGDLTSAFAMFQEANALLDANGAKMQLIAAYANASDAAVAGITRATGGITPDAALGGKAASFQADLDRLHAFDTELTGLFDANATKTLTDLKSHLKLNDDGSVRFDNPGDPKAQLELTDDTYFALKPNGEISVESRPPVNKDGKQTYGDDKTVTVKVRSGSHVIDAQAAFTIGEVGSFVDPTDATHLLKLMGKVVQQKVDGKWVSFYENPFAPGTATGWSQTPYVFNPPSNGSFKSTPDGAGGTTYSWQAGPNTLALVFDPKSGTYQMTTSSPGGLFQSEVKDQYAGSAGDAAFTSQITASGIARQGGGTGFDATDQPVFGFSDYSDYDAWKKSFQPPALATLGQAPPRDTDRDITGYSAESAARARKLAGINADRPEDTVAQKAATDAGNNAVASAYTARAKAQAAMDASALKTGNAVASSAFEARARAEAGRSVLPATVPTAQSQAARDGLAKLAARPTPVNPAWVADQKLKTSPPPTSSARRTAPPPSKGAPKAKRPTPKRAPLPKPVAAPPKTAGSGLANRAL